MIRHVAIVLAVAAVAAIAIVANLAIDSSFLVFEIRRFTSCQLTALDSVRDAVLLILGTLPDFALRIRVLHRRVVLVLVNLFRQLILLLVDHLAIRAREFAAVLTAHQLLFFVQVRFFALEIGGFASG